MPGASIYGPVGIALSCSSGRPASISEAGTANVTTRQDIPGADRGRLQGPLLLHTRQAARTRAHGRIQLEMASTEELTASSQDPAAHPPAAKGGRGCCTTRAAAAAAAIKDRALVTSDRTASFVDPRHRGRVTATPTAGRTAALRARLAAEGSGGKLRRWDGEELTIDELRADIFEHVRQHTAPGAAGYVRKGAAAGIDYHQHTALTAAAGNDGYFKLSGECGRRRHRHSASDLPISFFIEEENVAASWRAWVGDLSVPAALLVALLLDPAKTGWMDDTVTNLDFFYQVHRYRPTQLPAAAISCPYMNPLPKPTRETTTDTNPPTPPMLVPLPNHRCRPAHPPSARTTAH